MTNKYMYFIANWKMFGGLNSLNTIDKVVKFFKAFKKNRSIKINKGTKYFALTGIGGNSSISLELGKENAKATRTP